MNKNIYKILSTLLVINSFDKRDYDLSLNILDEHVNDCLLNLYFALLTDDDAKSEKYYNEFERKYDSLNIEQKEVVKKEIENILNTKDKPKVKKKER